MENPYGLHLLSSQIAKYGAAAFPAAAGAAGLAALTAALVKRRKKRQRQMKKKRMAAARQPLASNSRFSRMKMPPMSSIPYAPGVGKSQR